MTPLLLVCAGSVVSGLFAAWSAILFLEDYQAKKRRR